jgi:hypothetical protein
LGPTRSKDWPSLNATGQPSTITQGPATFMFTGARFAPDHTVYFFSSPLAPFFLPISPPPFPSPLPSPLFPSPSPLPPTTPPNQPTTNPLTKPPKQNKPLLPQRHSPCRLQPHPRRQRVVRARHGLGRRLLDVPLRLGQRRPLWLCACDDHRGGGSVGVGGFDG